MGISVRTSLAVALGALCLSSALGAARAGESEASRAARWHDVAAAIFKNQPITENSGLLQLEAPPRALDAALVPVSVTIAPDAKIVALTLVIDDNPAPVAAKFEFGPLADAHLLKTRIRVDQYTLLHAVAQLQDGTLVGTSRFIKAAGGCSAPGGTDPAAALARIGKMKLHLLGVPAQGVPVQAELLISHPNANGMQMDPLTRLYTPARYVQTVSVTEGGQAVFTMEGDISLAEDPEITFGFRPSGPAPLDVVVVDSAKTVFHRSFPLATHAS